MGGEKVAQPAVPGGFDGNFSVRRRARGDAQIGVGKMDVGGGFGDDDDLSTFNEPLERGGEFFRVTLRRDPYCTSVTNSAAAERRSNTSTIASSAVTRSLPVKILGRWKRLRQYAVFRGNVDHRLVIRNEQRLRELAVFDPIDDGLR